MIQKKRNGFFRKAADKLAKALRPPRMHNYVGLLYKDLIIMSRTIGFWFNFIFSLTILYKSWNLILKIISKTKTIHLRFLFFQIFIPILQISLFCMCIGREPYDLDFGIVNNETLYNASRQDGGVIFINELSNKTFKKVSDSGILNRNFKRKNFNLLWIDVKSITWTGLKRIDSRN